MGNGMNKVLSGLYVGNYRDSKDAAQLERHRITHILAVHDAARRIHSDKHYLCIMAADTPDQNLTQYFSLCNDFIHAARLRDGSVLIHCLAGMSRSVTVAVAYIMCVTPLSWREALKVVRAGRSVANPNLGFQRQLQDFETYKLVEERRRLKERYPSLALVEADLRECRLMLESYKTMLSQRTICEGKCALGRHCPTGVCRTWSQRGGRARFRGGESGGARARGDARGDEDRGGVGAGAGAGESGLSRSPSTLSAVSAASYRPRSSPAGLYSYTGAAGVCVSGGVTRVSDDGGSALAVGGSAYQRRRAASAPATPLPSPPTSPRRQRPRPIRGAPAPCDGARWR